MDVPYFPSSSESFSTAAKYTIDYTTNPVQINIFDFSYPKLKEVLFLGIMEFKGNNTARLYGDMLDPFGDNPRRPEEFGSDTIEFERI